MGWCLTVVSTATISTATSVSSHVTEACHVRSQIKSHVKVSWYEPFLKPLLNLLKYYFCFMFWVFLAPKHVGSWTPQPGINRLHRKMTTRKVLRSHLLAFLLSLLGMLMIPLSGISDTLGYTRWPSRCPPARGRSDRRCPWLVTPRPQQSSSSLSPSSPSSTPWLPLSFTFSSRTSIERTTGVHSS